MKRFQLCLLLGMAATQLNAQPGNIDLSAANEPWVREWTVTATAPELSRGIRPGFYANGARGDANPPAGRTGLLYLHPPAQGQPVRLERDVRLGQNPVLRLSVAGNRNGDWDLRVVADGRPLGNARTIAGAKGWQDLSYDLAPYAGRTVHLAVEAHPTGWAFEFVFVDSIQVDGAVVDSGSIFDRGGGGRGDDRSDRRGGKGRGGQNSLTGAWVNSADARSQTPDDKVILIHDGPNVTLMQSYKTRGEWVTSICKGPLTGRNLRMQCEWAPGGNPFGFANANVEYQLSGDGNHLDGYIGRQESHFTRVP